MIDLESLSMYNMTDDKQTSASTNHKQNSVTTVPSNYNYQDGINIARVAVMANSLSNIIDAPKNNTIC
jgi:hypothetical protein